MASCPPARAAVRREGSDVTILSYLSMVGHTLEAVEQTGIDAEVIDLRWLDLHQSSGLIINIGILRNNIHQRRNRLPRTSYCIRFKKLTDLVKKHNRYTFRIFPQSHSAKAGNSHEEILIKDFSLPQVLYSLHEHRPAGTHISHEINTQTHCVRNRQQKSCSIHASNKQNTVALIPLLVS